MEKYIQSWGIALILASASFPAQGCKETPPEPSAHNEPDTSSHQIVWRTDSLGYFMSHLLDVWGTSPTNVYAVGLLQTIGSEPTRFITHFDGSNWTTLRDDSLSWWLGAGVLAGIHGSSDSSIFVVGSRYHSNPATGFAAFWNGRRWKDISPRNSKPLFSVWSRSAMEAYACGDSGTLLRYNGTTWKALQSGTALDIWQITSLTNGNIYAVASDFFNSFAGSAVLRIDGESVALDHSFPVGQKFGLWGTTPSLIYATGEGTFKKADRADWIEISTPNPRVVMWSVSGTGSNNVFVAGAYGAVIHWSGKSWMFYDELYDRSSFKSYFKVFAIGNKCFLAGNTPSLAMITIGTQEMHISDEEGRH